MSSNRKVIIALLSLILVLLVSSAALILSSRQSHAEQAVYTGNEKHQITYAEGKKMIESYLNARVSNDMIAAYFGRNIFDKILKQDRCVGIRIYKAKLEDGTATFVLIGVDGNGKDMISGVVGEDAYPCPPFCECPPVCYSTDVASASVGANEQSAKR